MNRFLIQRRANDEMIKVTISMNTTVTATGMTISAKTDSLFLVINAGAVFDETNTETTANTSATAKQLLPVAHGTFTSKNGTQTPITVAGDMTDYTKWWYAYSDKTNLSEEKANTAVQVASAGDLAKYVASEKFSVGVNENSGLPQAQNLTITSVTLPADKGIVLVLVCGTNVFEFKSDYDGSGDPKILATTAFENVVVDAYYYIDGENENVTSVKSTTLSGTCMFTLEAEGAAA